MTGRWHRVRIHWPAGRTHDDHVRRRTPGEAIANAVANWITENPPSERGPEPGNRTWPGHG